MVVPRGRFWRYAFDPSTARGRLGIIGAFLLFLGMTWTVNVGLAVLGTNVGPWSALTVSAAILFAGALLLAVQARLVRDRLSYYLEPPTPARGLILSLSLFNGRDSDFKNVADIQQLGTSALDEAKLAKTNWGPLYVAARHHAQTLERCWLLCSEGSCDQFDVASTLIKYAVSAASCDRKVEVDWKLVRNVNDIADVARVVDGIYKDAAIYFNLGPKEIVADITGGTAAMSAGMVIAALPEDRRLEYLRQDVPLVVDGRLLSAEELSIKKGIVELQVCIELLPEGVQQELS